MGVATTWSFPKRGDMDTGRGKRDDLACAAASDDVTTLLSLPMSHAAHNESRSWQIVCADFPPSSKDVDPRAADTCYD